MPIIEKRVDKKIRSETLPKNKKKLNLEDNPIQYHLFFYLHTIIQLVIFFYFIPKFFAPWIWPKEFPNPNPWGYILAAANHEFFFILINISYFILYKFKFSFFEQFKVEAEKWPWDEDYISWIALLKRMMKTLFINHFIIIPLTIVFFSKINDKFYFRVDFESLPTPTEVIIQFVFVYIINDISFYLSHWLLHHEIFYNRIHKIHHETKVTFSLAVEYAHPIEYVFANILAFNLGGSILSQRMHLFTNLLISVIISLRSCESHSGYDFPWSPSHILPKYFKFMNKNDFHSFHHLKYKGNYSGGINWDYLGKTLNPLYIEYRKIQGFNKMN